MAVSVPRVIYLGAKVNDLGSRKHQDSLIGKSYCLKNLPNAFLKLFQQIYQVDEILAPARNQNSYICSDSFLSIGCKMAFQIEEEKWIFGAATQ